MAINMLALKGLKLGHTDWVFVDDAGKIHKFRKANDLGMVTEGKELFNWQVRASRFQMRGWHTRRELHANIPDGFKRPIEEELTTFSAQHIGNFMRIADDGGHAIRQDAAIKFMRRDK